MHEFHSNVNKVNKAVAKVRTIGDRLPLTWLAWESLRDLGPAGATDALPSTRRSYQISLTWLWSTRARVTDSDHTVQRGIRTSVVLTFGLRVGCLNHSATRSIVKLVQPFLQITDLSNDVLAQPLLYSDQDLSYDLNRKILELN